jgi:hypothetical protein
MVIDKYYNQLHNNSLKIIQRVILLIKYYNWLHHIISLNVKREKK